MRGLATDEESRGWLAVAAAAIGGTMAWLRGAEARRQTEAARAASADQLDAEQIRQLLHRVNVLEERSERQSGKIVHLESEKLDLQRENQRLERELSQSNLRIAELQSLIDSKK